MQPELRHQPQDRFLDAGDVRLHYLEWGQSDANPFVLLHGFTSHGHCWDFLADALCEEYRVLALDLRGHGDSDWSPRGYSNGLMVQDLGELVRSIGLSKILLLGMSLGGLNAIEYAALHPEKIERLIIVDIGPVIPRNGNPRELFSRFFLGQELFDSPEEAFSYRRKTDQRPVEELERYLTVHALKKLPSEKWTWKFDKTLRSPLKLALVRTPLGFLTNIRLPNLWSLLPRIQCPTLILHGAESPVLSQQVAERMQQLIPDCRLVTFPQCSHRIHIERPQDFEAAIRKFVAP